MTPKRSFQLLLTLSILYGITVAILGYLGTPGFTIFAIAGALIIGALWALRGIFADRRQGK